MLNYKLVTALGCSVISVIAGCTPSTKVKFNDPQIYYAGRVNMKPDGADLSWTASSVYLNFKGTGASAVLNDTKGTDLVTVVVDGKVMQTLQPKKNKEKDYELVSGLPNAPHKLQLFKRTEFQMGTLQFKGFSLADTGKLLSPPTFKHRIEFYANSITCGYALEDPEGKDRGDYGYENGYLSYAALTARHFNAQYHCIAKSGIGVTISWFPYIMPEIYDRIDPLDPKSKWDFSRFTPEVVVVNLFQNDYHLVNNVNHKEFKARFGSLPPTPDFIIDKYRQFIQSIRSKYPFAKIICALGSMDSNEPGSPFPKYISKAVEQLNDTNIYTLFFPYLGEHRHPNRKEHEQMAAELINFIQVKFDW